MPDVVCPPAKGVTDPAVSVPDASRLPLTNPDSVASAERNLEVLRGLLELELLKLLGQLQEQGSIPVFPPTSGAPEEVGRRTSFHTFRVPVTGNTIRLDTTPPPGFQTRLIAHQESTSIFLLREIPEVIQFPVFLLREVPDMMEWLLLVVLAVHFRFLLYYFLRVRKPDVTP
jgi:hypothetical protein